MKTFSAILAVLFAGAIAVGQERKQASTSCSAGNLTLGIPILIGNAPSCYKTDWNDLWTFSAPGQVDVAYISEVDTLVTIQDSTGVVLASSSMKCGPFVYQPACSFTYTLPASGTYFIGVSGKAGGGYSLGVRTVSGPSSSSDALYLTAARFKVSVQWKSPTASGSGNPVFVTSETGYFTFFDGGNVELVIKVLDGRAINNHFWVFAAGLTNVNVDIMVTDTQTGAVKRYTNPQGIAFQPVQDTSAF